MLLPLLLLLLLLAVLYSPPPSGPSWLRSLRYLLNYNLAAGQSLAWDLVLGRADGPARPLEQRPQAVAIVTGGGRGLGQHVVAGLLQAGSTVVVAVRRPADCEEWLKEVNAAGGGRAVAMQLDVASMASVRNFANQVCKQFPRIDLLVNNAGKLFGPRLVTEDGFESQLATNFLGHALLTHLILPHMPPGGRVVHVSSCAHRAAHLLLDDIHQEQSYHPHAGYSQSKLAQLMFSLELDRRLSHLNIRSIAAHPGCVSTAMADDLKGNCFTELIYRVLRTPQQGAEPVLAAALGPYRRDRLWGPSWASAHACDEALQKKLFQLTCDMLSIKEFGVREEAAAGR